jgi:hypothetical protein
MEQSTINHYKVKTAEKIQLTIRTLKVNNPPAVSLDGSAVPPDDPANPWQRSFVIAKKTGSQALTISCSFDATAPADAAYTFTLQGNGGGSAYDAGDVEAGDPDWTASYTFFVS